jgi:long-chain acyl-CoA synthetase
MYDDEIQEKLFKPAVAKRGPLDLVTKTNLVHQFRETVRAHPDFPALRTRKVLPYGKAEWVTKTYREFAEAVDELAAALIDLGVKLGDKITLQSHTREEWAIIDEAVLGIGAVVACAYPSLAPAVVEYQINDSESTIAIIERKEHVDALVSLKDNLPGLRMAIAIDDPARDDPGFEMPPWLVTLQAMMERGRALLAENPALRETIHAFEQSIDPDSIATIVYTSGTTGMPKGAVLTHWNIVSNVKSVAWFTALDLTGKTNLSFLPLSHILERMGGHFYPISIGMCTAFASDIDNLSRDLKEIEPEYLVGVPRVFEKIYAFAMQSVNNYPAFERRVFNWAVKVGGQYDGLFRAHEHLPLGLKMKLRMARALVFGKVLEQLGGNLLFFVSGGASLPIDLAKFYGAVGLVIVEGYGLTETSPVTNLNDPLDMKYGYVGPPIPGTEEKLGDDGEILVRGPQVFTGYWNKPEQTAEAIDEEGWFHTGDLGEFDKDGCLKIVGRKKEIFVLSTGKKVPPLVVEELAATSRFINQLVLEGDGRKFISALLTPNFPALHDHVTRDLPDLAASMPDFGNGAEQEIEAFLAKAEIRALFQQDIDEINAKVDPFAQVKKFEILPCELTEETGDITPSLKFKRKAIFEHYRDRIEFMYQAGVSESFSSSAGPMANGDT